MRTINAQFKIKKAVFESDGFCIYAGLPVDDMAFVLKLNKYNNCSLKTDGLKLKVNKTYSLEIEEVEDSYGISYKVLSNGLSFDAVENITPELNYQLLTEIMTDTQAKAIQEYYPNFVQLVLTNQIDKIDVSKIRGVGSKLLEKYVNKIKWRCSSYLLRGDMPQFHFTEMESRRLLDLYGNIQTIKDEVMANPYKVLVDRLNRSFWSVDAELAPEYRYNKDRIEYLILEILRQNEYEGHTWMPADALGSKVVAYDPEIANVVVDVVDNSESITLDLDKNLIQRTSMYYAEKNIADFIKSKVEQDDPLDWDWQEYVKIKDGTLTDEQKEVLRLFCKYNFVNLIGNSGCGKSSSIMALLQMIEDNGLDYICVSPTGKAAKRLSEQTGRPAHTIHMACIQGDIYESVIIVDEVSMLSVDVCNMLFNAIQNDKARIVFVGDDGQLPPVGVGRILRDTLASGIVPTARLTKCFRFNEGGMAMVGELTRRGDLSVFEDTTTHLGDDFTFIPFESTDQVVMRYVQEANEVGVDNVMLLTPYNKGEYGTVAINNAIQAEINPLKDGEDFVKLKIEGKDVIFHVGDTVLNCKNNYGLFDVYDNATSIMNGATGKIISLRNEDGDVKIHIEFDGKEIVFDRSSMQNLKLGYAISVHKCQGSEAHTVINLTIRPHMPMLSRQLSYTARTRARKKMIEFGTPIAIDKGQKVNLNDMTNTRLDEFLTKEEIA